MWKFEKSDTNSLRDINYHSMPQLWFHRYVGEYTPVVAIYDSELAQVVGKIPHHLWPLWLCPDLICLSTTIYHGLATACFTIPY